MLTEREVVDPTLSPPRRKAASEIALQAGGGLVAIFGGFGEQPHDNRREHRRHAGHSLGGWHRPPSDVAVHPFHRIRRGKWQRTREHLVENNTERVKVAAGVYRAVHSSGLLRGHVGERAGDGLGRFGRLALAWQARSEAEPGESHLSIQAVHHDFGGLQVFVDKAAPVELAQCCRDSGRDLEQAPYLHGSPKLPGEHLTPWIL